MEDVRAHAQRVGHCHVGQSLEVWPLPLPPGRFIGGGSGEGAASVREGTCTTAGGESGCGPYRTPLPLVTPTPFLVLGRGPLTSPGGGWGTVSPGSGEAGPNNCYIPRQFGPTTSSRFRMEVLDEFDSEFPQSVTFCQLISEKDFERQAATYTERSLRRLFRSLDRNPALAERVVRKGKQTECEQRGLLSFLWVRDAGGGEQEGGRGHHPGLLPLTAELRGGWDFAGCSGFGYRFGRVPLGIAWVAIRVFQKSRQPSF